MKLGQAEETVNDSKWEGMRWVRSNFVGENIQSGTINFTYPRNIGYTTSPPPQNEIP